MVAKCVFTNWKTNSFTKLNWERRRKNTNGLNSLRDKTWKS